MCVIDCHDMTLAVKVALNPNTINQACSVQSSKLTLYYIDTHADRLERVYRRRGEHFADACVIERDRFGGGLV